MIIEAIDKTTNQELDAMRFAIGLLIILLASQVVGSLSAQPFPEGQAERQPQNAGAPMDRLSDQQRAWLARGEHHDKAGWIYLHIAGEARERGFQHGYLLAKEIHDCLRSTQVECKHQTAMEWSWLIEQSKRMFIPTIDPENLAEIDGMVEGLAVAGVHSSREELVAYNGIIELLFYWWPKEKERLEVDGVTNPRQSCSAFIATGNMTADGGVVLAHNMMSGYAAVNCYVVLDIRPAKGHRILWQGAPGWIHSGTDFFITDAGLIGAETTIGGFKGFDLFATQARDGLPELLNITMDVGEDTQFHQETPCADATFAIAKEGHTLGRFYRGCGNPANVLRAKRRH
ncbi:MAG: C45 family peptidase [Pirellulaceae bacterium]